MAFLRKSFLMAIGFFMAACSSQPSKPMDYRAEMRAFVSAMSVYAKAKHPGFLIVPQNGIELISPDYLAAIDAVGQESLHFSHALDERTTGEQHRQYLYGYLNRVKDAEKRVFVTDYVGSVAQAGESDRLNAAAGFEGFAATSRELDGIPRTTGSFLYLINPGKFSDKEEYLAALESASQGLLIVDSSYSGDHALSSQDVARLQKGGRTVIAYLSVGEAETYRSYWDPTWKETPPPWLAEENPDWEGNIKVHYWDPAWQKIIFGSPDAALDQILAAGFDGVYLDIVDAYGYFEAKRNVSDAS